MARRALIWHLYPTYLLVTVASLLAFVGYSSTSLSAFYRDQVSLELESRAALLHDQIASYLRGLCRVTAIVPISVAIIRHSHYRCSSVWRRGCRL